MRQFQIKLLSDACISSGENFGTIIDTDVCYDRFGYPYIPAKRIKGCLREIGIDLIDWGIGEKSFIQILFGIEGACDSGLIITDAELENVEQRKMSIQMAKKKRLDYLLSPQNILENYTYMRTQTALEDGVAKKNSLRSCRVMKKGLEFYFQCNIDDYSKEVQTFFGQCCKGLWHMGLNRTRGFGHVVLTEYPMASKNNKIFDVREIQSILAKANCEKDELFELKFNIFLESPMVFPKNTVENPSTELYIPGSSILGYFASRYAKEGKEDFEELFLSGNIIFQNAYITDGKHQYIPAPLFLYKEKDNLDNFCYNSFHRESINHGEEKKKLKKLDECFVYFNFEEEQNGETSLIGAVKKIHKMTVEKSLSYHYRGKNDNGNQIQHDLFTLMSIDKNQIFTARIITSLYYFKQLLPLFSKDGLIQLGTSKSVQYGRGRIISSNFLPHRVNKQEVIFAHNKFIVLLKSPLIMMDPDTLSYSTDTRLVQRELEHYIGSCTLIDSTVQYKLVGGFNVKWRLPKPKVVAFDAGSVFVFSSEKNMIDISFIKSRNLGERTQEGFGEIGIYPFECFKQKMKSVESNIDTQTMIDISTRINIQTQEDSFHYLKETDIKPIVFRIFCKELQEQARRRANTIFAEEKKGSNCMNGVMVSRAYLQWKENKTLSEFINGQLDIKQPEKCMQSFSCIWNIKIESQAFNKKADKYHLKKFCIEEAKQFLRDMQKETYSFQREELKSLLNIEYDDLYRIYVKTFLEQAKLILRKNNNEKGEVRDESV